MLRKYSKQSMKNIFKNPRQISSFCPQFFFFLNFNPAITLYENLSFVYKEGISGYYTGFVNGKIRNNQN